MTWLRGRVVLVLVLVLDAGARRVVLVGHRLVAQPACRRYAATDRQLRPPIVARLAPRRDDAGEWLAGSHWLVGFRLASDRLQFGPGYPIRIRWVVLVDSPRTIFFCYYKPCPKH